METFENGFGPYGSFQTILGIKSENTFQTRSGELDQIKKNVTICRLCLLEINDNNLTLLEGVIKDMLEIILPELKLSICDSPTICNSCLETLKQSYNFKSSCLEVEDKVQDFIDPKTPILIDLKAVILKRNHLSYLKDNQSICRTCLNIVDTSSVTKMYSFEGDPLKNMVDKCLPEMGIELTKAPVICPICLELLEEQFHFVMQCLDSEEKINYYCEKKNCYKQINLHSVYLFSMCIEDDSNMEKLNVSDGFSNDFNDLQSNNSESRKNSDEIRVLAASDKNSVSDISIKVDSEERNLTELQETETSDNMVDVVIANDDLLQLKFSVNVSNQPKDENEKETSPQKILDEEEESVSEEDPEDFSYYPTGPKKAMIKRCRYCKFKTKFKLKLKTHILSKHTAKNVRHLNKSHKLENKESLPKNSNTQTANSELNIKPFQCPKCSMAFRYSTNMEKHMTIHDEANQRKPIMNKPVNQCNYVQKHTYRYDRHMLTMYRCKLCPYQSRLRSNLDKHSKTHKTTTDIKMHKCKVCKFETIQKETLVSHMKTHDTPESKMRKCFLCSYQTKRIDYLKKHVKQVHKAGSG
ncbi:zinc finger Y-chromosomal protein 1-like [Cylas formicarius]|uniref:zinc finger Y-chromosomal protein 1-like n=1 Tax=Cylas formicarius TaxID=197179 RepID=UPI0029588D6F|nr:zinc finger Y-chromosomal protein 1-like [Cylas formicarius]